MGIAIVIKKFNVSAAFLRFAHFCALSALFPKGPRRTKNSTCSKFTTRSEFTIAL